MQECIAQKGKGGSLASNPHTAGHINYYSPTTTET